MKHTSHEATSTWLGFSELCNVRTFNQGAYFSISELHCEIKDAGATTNVPNLKQTPFVNGQMLDNGDNVNMQIPLEFAYTCASILINRVGGAKLPPLLRSSANNKQDWFATLALPVLAI